MRILLMTSCCALLAACNQTAFTSPTGGLQSGVAVAGQKTTYVRPAIDVAQFDTAYRRCRAFIASDERKLEMDAARVAADAPGPEIQVDLRADPKASIMTDRFRRCMLSSGFQMQ